MSRLRRPTRRRLIVAAGMSALAVAGALGGVYGYFRYQIAFHQWLSRQVGLSQMPLGPENPPSPENFYPVRAVPRQPPITEFPVLPAEEAAETLKDDELVLGLMIDGESRAYPLNMLNGPIREILNDTVGGRPIAATW